MQKLVSINSLRDRFNVAERCEDCGRDAKYCDGGLYGYESYTARDICEILDDTPVVEAIPIEWLRKVMLNDVNDEISSEAASRIIELWQKEQEAE